MATAHVSTTKVQPPAKGTLKVGAQLLPEPVSFVTVEPPPVTPAPAAAGPAPNMTLAALREARDQAEKQESNLRESNSVTKKATGELLRTLQTVKVMAPLLRAVAVRPGPERPGEQMQAVGLLVRAFVSAREQLVDAIAPERLLLTPLERTRIRNAVTQVVAESMGALWDEHGVCDMQTTIIEWVNLLDDIAPSLRDDWLPSEAKVSTTLELELSLVRAVAPLQAAIAKWDFWHPEPRELLASVSREVWDMAADAARDLISHHKGVNAAGTVIATMQSLLRHGVTTLAWRWNRAGVHAEQQLSKLSPLALDRLREQYAETGMPTTKMMTAFRKDFNDLILQAREAVAKNSLVPDPLELSEPK